MAAHDSHIFFTATIALWSIYSGSKIGLSHFLSRAISKSVLGFLDWASLKDFTNPLTVDSVNLYLVVIVRASWVRAYIATVQRNSGQCFLYVDLEQKYLTVKTSLNLV